MAFFERENDINMQMINPFTIVLISIYLYIIFTEKTVKGIHVKCLCLSAIVQVFAFMGYFISTGSNWYTYDKACLFMMFCNSIFLIFNKRKNMQVKKCVLSWLFMSILSIVIISNFMLIITPYDGLVVDHGAWVEYVVYRLNVEVYPNFNFLTFLVQTIYVLSFILTFFTVKVYYKTEDLLCLYRWADKFFSVYLFLLFLELIMANIFNSNFFTECYTSIFGVDNSTTIELVTNKGDTVGIHGVTREPQHLAYSLLMFMVLNVIYKCKVLKRTMNKYDILKLLFSSMLMFSSGAFSSIVYIFCFLLFCLLLYVERLSKKKKIVALCVLVPSILLIGNTLVILIANGDGYFAMKMNNTLEILYQPEALRGSGIENATRLISIYKAIEYFLNSPFIGLGLGVVDCHSTWISFIASVGMFGFFCWFKFVFSGGEYNKLLILLFYFLPGIVIGLADWVYTFYMIYAIEGCKKGNC